MSQTEHGKGKGAGELDERLLTEFAPHTYEQWREAAEALLKGKPFDKVMRTPTVEGFTVEPIYRAADLEGLPHLGQLPGLGGRVRHGRASGYLRQGWEISQELPYGTPEEFNEVALADLQRGQSELNVLLDLASRAGEDPDTAEAGRVGACGLSLASLRDLERALRGVHLEYISVYLRAGSSGLPLAALLLAYAARHKVKLAQLRGCIEMDPLASVVMRGDISVSLETAFDEMARLTAYAAERVPQLQTIGVQGHPYHDGGATATQELAYALATGVEYLRQLERRGVAVEQGAPRMRLALSVGSDFFLEIAKLRAARLLWARMLEAFGVREELRGVHLHARTSLWNKTRLDPNVNMLRVTAEAFAAVLGGCSSLHVGPFDEVVRVPDAFSRRVARNVQIILMEECELTRTVDPAGGSWAVEKLTDEVARGAWKLFQEIEAAGGMLAALKAGAPQVAVAASAQAKWKRYGQRRDVQVGTNMYPNASEKPLEARIPDYAQLREKRAREVAAYRTGAEEETDTAIMDALNNLSVAESSQAVDLAVDAALAGATLGEISRALRGGMGEPARGFAKIPFRRASEPFERMREQARRIETLTGQRPTIFQANLGPSGKYRLRADWTSAFFQTAGFRMLAEEDFDTPAAAAEAAARSAARIVVIVSTDDAYPEQAPALARALKILDPEPYVLLAGAPGEQEAAYREAGVDAFVHVRVNNLELNEQLLEKYSDLQG